VARTRLMAAVTGGLWRVQRACYVLRRVPATYALEDLRARVEDARGGRIQVTWNVKASTAVVADKLDLTLSEAQTFIYEGLCRLQPANFAHVSCVAGTSAADVYGIDLRRFGWYVKFKLVPQPLNVCSFHPPATPLQTRAGLVR